TVSGQDGMRWSRELAAKEGIFTGTSGGSTFATAMDVARSAAPGSVILCMLPDTGERYLSTPLFADVGAEMNEDEIALSKSTPGYQL
ncbi:MAG: cysteine synthase, partial [Pseudomonadota bacterium]